jgi:hypothetical protein
MLDGDVTIMQLSYENSYTGSFKEFELCIVAFYIENKHIALHCFLLTKPDGDKIIAGTSSGDECVFE